MTLAEVDELPLPPQGVPVRLPHRMSGLMPGRTAALIQYLITAARTAGPTSTIRSYLSTSSDREARLRHFIYDDACMTAAIMFAKVMDDKNQTNLRNDAVKLALRRLEETEQRIEVHGHGPSTLLLAVDHGLGWRPRRLYFERETLQSAEVMSSETAKIVAHNTSTQNDRRKVAFPLDRAVRERLAGFIFELFKNTHQWARRDQHGVVTPSVRGIRIEAHTAKKSFITKHNESDSPLSTFLSRLPERRSTVRLAEISVFDSGPGIVQTWRRGREARQDHAADATAERELCMLALAKHASASSDPSRGNGIFQAMMDISRLGGIVRLRTGNLSLFRDFSQEPLDPRGGGIQMNDWQRKGRTVPHRSGVLFTAIFPVERP